jgi:hypothetical protein
MSAWTGILIGGVAGGIAGFALTKVFLRRGDLGVTGAAAAFGALAGGALTANPASASSGGASAPTPSNLALTPAKTFYTLPLDGRQTSARVTIGDVVRLQPSDGVTASFTTNGSDAILALGQNDGVYQAVKLGGGIVTATLSNGSVVKVKIEVA